MVLFEVLFLAVVQGIAEFLPISSSGHVVVAATAFDEFGHTMGETLTLNVVLHVGTLAAIIVFYRKRLLELFGRDRRVLALLAVGTLPAVIIAPPIRLVFGEAFQSALLAGCMFPLTGAMLLWTARIGPGAMLVALLAAAMGGLQHRLAAVAVAVTTLCFFFGMVIAVALERSIF